MKEIIAKIMQLQALRSGIPQFLFCSGIHPYSMKQVRESVVIHKRANKNCEEIDFIVSSPGGSADDAYRIITTLRRHFKTVNVIIPFWAKSAATLLSLGASKLIFSEFGELGPLDVQLGKERDDSPEYERESALNDDQSIKILEEHFKIMYETMFIRIYEHKKIKIPKTEVSRQLLANISKLYEPMLRQINPYKLGDKQRKLNIAVEYAKRILVAYGQIRNPVEIRAVTTYLVDGFPDHGTVIDYNLMNNLLPNCHTGNIFGDEYEEALNDLSLLFIADEEDYDHVGFIKDDSKADNTSNDNQDVTVGEEAMVTEVQIEGVENKGESDVGVIDEINTPTEDEVEDI